MQILFAAVGISTRLNLAQANLIVGCPFPGNGALVVYPGCEICIDAGGIEISIDDAGKLQIQSPSSELPRLSSRMMKSAFILLQLIRSVARLPGYVSSSRSMPETHWPS